MGGREFRCHKSLQIASFFRPGTSLFVGTEAEILWNQFITLSGVNIALTFVAAAAIGTYSNGRQRLDNTIQIIKIKIGRKGAVSSF